MEFEIKIEITKGMNKQELANRIASALSYAPMLLSPGTYRVTVKEEGVVTK